MALPSFVLGGNSLTFSKGIRLPVRAPREAVQAVDRTASGSLEVEALGIIIKRITIEFANLPLADYDALVNWYDVIASGAANAFTYNDPDENAWLVRWMNTFNFYEAESGFSGSIELEVVA